MSERLFGTASARLLRAIASAKSRGTAVSSSRSCSSVVTSSGSGGCAGRSHAGVACGRPRRRSPRCMCSDSITEPCAPRRSCVAASNAGGSRVKLLDLGTGDRAATAAKDVRCASRQVVHRLLIGKPAAAGEGAAGNDAHAGLNGAPPALEEALGRWLDGEATLEGRGEGEGAGVAGGHRRRARRRSATRRTASSGRARPSRAGRIRCRGRRSSPSGTTANTTTDEAERGARAISRRLNARSIVGGVRMRGDDHARVLEEARGRPRLVRDPRPAVDEVFAGPEVRRQVRLDRVSRGCATR